VGLWHGDDRWGEYLPPVPDADADGAESRRPAGSGPSRADEVLAFVTDVVKPMVDRRYPTDPAPAATSVLGSSMGGLAALHALEARPDVFGAAACLSTHWPAGGDPLVDAMASRLPAPGRHRLYLDHGTEDLDAAYAPFQQRFDAALAARGYRHGGDCLSVTFPGADHHERAWAARAPVPLLFLLAGAEAAAAAATALGGRPARI
jgi:predicted alpha/beta superfamily hydrolase